jgi:hypothetical protein
MAKDIICTLTSSRSITSKRVVAIVLGVDKQNIPRAMLKHVELDIVNDVFWLIIKKLKDPTLY